jgi:4-amino-4-deoxy-L-arabinose transferase-like glycosyltransferase
MTADAVGTPSRPGLLADVVPALGLLLFHLAFLPGYGVFRDELYYLACGRHPGWGYVDHPPLVGWVAWVARQVVGDSHLALRVVAALAAAATVFVAARIAKELGGGLFARLFTGLVVALLPIALALGSVFSMNVFDLLFWAVLFWILARVLGGADERLWLAFGAVAGLGLLNKISVLFLGAGLVMGLVLSRRWEVFRSRWFWAGGAVAAFVFLPHLVWQQLNGWPTLEFMANARRFKMAPLSVGGFLSETQLHTAVAPWLWVLGVGWLLFARRGRPFRPLGFAFLTVLVVLVATGGKPYYLGAGYAAPLAGGAVAVEGVSADRFRWLRWVLAVLVIAAGLLVAPLARPILPVDTFVRYADVLGISSSPEERHEMGRLPQFYADMHGWKAMAETVAGVVRGLPEGERAKACVFGQN